ncbi:MAG: sugar porter family MFS transporter [Chthoniobacterales bacterium]
MKGNRFYVIAISAVAALGGFLFGFDSGVINGTVDALNRFFHTSNLSSGFNVASILLGCAAGAFIAGGLSDKLGRRAVLIMAAILFVLASWGTGVAHGSLEFVTYRVLGGLAVGAASIICPAYISEIAPARIRGRLASLQQLAIVLGLFCAFMSNYLIARAAHTASAPFWLGFKAWQWMFWVEIIPSVIFLLGLLLIPESPRFLVAARKSDAARKVLTRLGEPNVEVRLRDIQESLERGHKPRMSDLYDPVARKIHPILWVGIGLAAFQQLVGINVVFYYGEVLWRAAGFSESNALLQNVISGTVNVGSTFVAIALVDKVGRKPLLIFGSIGMAIVLAIMAWIFAASPLDPQGKLAMTDSAGLAALIAANAYIFCFGVSWGPVMWVMLGEMFPNQFRGAALSVSGFIQWISNFGITITFPILLGSFGLSGAYSLYAAFAAVSIWFVMKLVRETKGKTLEDM